MNRKNFSMLFRFICVYLRHLRIINLFTILSLPLIIIHCGTASLDSLPKASANESIKLGWEKYEIGEYEGARADFSDAVRVAPDLVDGYNGLGWSNFRLLLPAQAILQFQTGVARDTSNVTVTVDMMVGLAFALYELDDMDGSDMSLARAIALLPEQFDLQGTEYLHNHDALVSSREVRLLQALVKFYKREYSQAVESLKLIDPTITLDPTQPGIEGALLKELERL